MNHSIPSVHVQRTEEYPILAELKIDSSTCTSILSYLLEMNIITRETIQDAILYIDDAKVKQQPQNDGYENKTNNEANAKNRKTEPQQLLLPLIPSSLNMKEFKEATSTAITANTSSTTATAVRTRHIALHVYYDGGSYSGLAENIGQANDTSIERELFLALQKANFISAASSSRDTYQYSRCGRTDKGVSACGQIVALQLKSAFPIEAITSYNPTTDASIPIDNDARITDNDLPKNSYESRTVWVPPRKRKSNGNNIVSNVTYTQKCMKEYAYDKILNNLLPSDIRILGWCPVSDTFSARFSCTTRTYRYFFIAPQNRHGTNESTTTTTSTTTPTTSNHGVLSIDRMKQGLQHMIGTHDFRNFCKMDVEKVYNFVRTIHMADIVVTSSLENVDVCYLHIVGQAFLWHQIRCIVHVLFLIGRGYEDPSIVLELLNIEHNPGKPSYPLADERPLVLHECLYTNLSFGYSVTNLWNIVTVQEQQWEEHILAAARIRNCLNKLQCKVVRVDELLEFATSKLQQRSRKQRGTQYSPSNYTLLPPPISSTGTIKWRDAQSWLETNGIIPDPSKLVECVYTPLLQRSKGTTYEEKVTAIQQKDKRQQKYETNVIKKRKTKEEDAAFYNHMSQQGGSSS